MMKKYWLAIWIASLFSSCALNGALKEKAKFEQQAIPTLRLADSTDNYLSIDSNFLFHNAQGLWELYVSGNPMELGLKTGILTQSLYAYQEKAFFSKIQEFIPSQRKQKWMMKLTKVYNRNIHKYIPIAYRKEIFGLSRYASPRYDSLIDPYQRNLFLHGAHDLGHAFQDLALVGCSSLAAWGPKSADGELIIGRNFDFYAGDDFSHNKLITIVKPDSGYSFLSVGWAGMIGVVSGMNSAGLTVTLNAGKSSIPWAAKTPISIVAREILQYARNFKEAIAIAKKHPIFISESLMIGSADEGRAILIEMSPHKFAVFESDNANYLLCTNHFQSSTYQSDKRNQKQIEESHSVYRHQLLTEQLQQQDKLTAPKVAAILRDRNGLKNKEIGYGNEKALNQLLAHHGIIFQPAKRLVWVSANPYQLGEFVCYDLNKIFDNKAHQPASTLANTALNIPQDTFLNSKAYRDYEEYRKRDRIIDHKLKSDQEITESEWQEYQKLNPLFWAVYYKRGTYYFERKRYEEALKQLQQADSCEVTTLVDRKNIASYIHKIEKKGDNR
ncbi:acyl-CoA--6-aminopenicillanic acid acyl-transferase [Sphingobacterium siyangense]|uniref:Acyl-CoA--6-aminopenicillanic acid acyl-transferase n=1 Tax=Sphingobacterium siyangense TaxID=459529 RepID=A0A420FQ41_9SPHI|nr:C45 family peptidase [Sphingobacterium siyangense]RKF34961.1 acyl-CoA--6-aminopenicillanic acid acyl-transferase [Sphingobacterium siyangense]